MSKKTRSPEIPDPPVVYPFPYALCRPKPPLEEQIAEAIAILKGEHYPHFYFLEWTPLNHEPDRYSGFVTDLVALKYQPDHPLAPFLARLLELIRKKFSPADLALPRHSAKTAVPAMTRLGGTFEPDARAHQTYEALFQEVYKQMYRRLRPLYERIQEITGYPPKV